MTQKENSKVLYGSTAASYVKDIVTMCDNLLSIL